MSEKSLPLQSVAALWSGGGPRAPVIGQWMMGWSPLHLTHTWQKLQVVEGAFTLIIGKTWSRVSLYRMGAAVTAQFLNWSLLNLWDLVVLTFARALASSWWSFETQATVCSWRRIGRNIVSPLIPSPLTRHLLVNVCVIGQPPLSATPCL